MTNHEMAESLRRAHERYGTDIFTAAWKGIAYAEHPSFVIAVLLASDDIGEALVQWFFQLIDADMRPTIH
jgi:hypothetical protein